MTTPTQQGIHHKTFLCAHKVRRVAETRCFFVVLQHSVQEDDGNSCTFFTLLHAVNGTINWFQ
jgi:hypothetical protein